MASTQDKPELLIEVYTDVMCPWCWCGEAQLQKTLQSDDFKEKVGAYMSPKVRLRPYLLDTRLPATSFDPPLGRGRYERDETTEFTKGNPPTKKEYYSKKFTNLDAFNTKITKAATEVGLPGFDWLSDGKVGATWLAHRLLWYAEQQDDKHDAAQNGKAEGNDGYRAGLQEQLAQRLYKGFFHENQDMSDVATLARLAHEAQVFGSQEEAKAWLEGSEGEREVGHAVDMAHQNGVQSVPFTMVQEGADHSSEVLNHDGYMRMFEMQAAFYKR